MKPSIEPARSQDDRGTVALLVIVCAAIAAGIMVIATSREGAAVFAPALLSWL